MENADLYKDRSLAGRIRRSRARSRVRRGRRALQEGSVDDAIEWARKAARIDPGISAAYQLMADSLMPGEDYLQILARLHADLKPQTYLEIGVASGRSAALASAGTRVVGIDPHPMIETGIDAHARLYPTTSDRFFDRWNILDELDTNALDLVFLDGLHTFEQALMDFIHVEPFGDHRTIVAVHDCLPVARRIASSKRLTKQWCGDVWKIVPCLQATRPDLTLLVVPTPPSGLLLISDLDSASKTLRLSYDSIVETYRDRELDYELLGKNDVEQAELVVPNDWNEIQRRLGIQG